MVRFESEAEEHKHNLIGAAPLQGPVAEIGQPGRIGVSQRRGSRGAISSDN